MLPNCKQVAEQVSENIDQPLSGTRWLKFKIHLLMCAYCRRYNQQLGIAAKTVGSLDGSEQPSEELRESVTSTYKDIHCNQERAPK